MPVLFSGRAPIPPSQILTSPERTLLVRRYAARLCLQLGWAPVHEVPLPNGRRADILALLPNGEFACIEVKSGARDFLADGKWQDYRDFCDRLYFAVDTDFPIDLLPDGVGVIIACPPETDLFREAPRVPMPPNRRRSLTQRFAWLSASRLAATEDPIGATMVRAALLAE